MNRVSAAKLSRFSKTKERGFRSLKYIIGIKTIKDQRFFIEKLGNKERLFNINSNLKAYKKHDRLLKLGLRV